MKPGMTRAELPLLALPGSFASKRKFDSIGMFKINNQRTKRFDGEHSHYRRDRVTDNLQHNEICSPIAPINDADRIFNKTVAHKFNSAGLELPLHLDK